MLPNLLFKDIDFFFVATGIEMSSTGPSTMQLMRLAANSEFRTAVQRVVSEMKNAGVDLNSAVSVPRRTWNTG